MQLSQLVALQLHRMLGTLDAGQEVVLVAGRIHHLLSASGEATSQRLDFGT